jgi:hypothetical protein
VEEFKTVTIARLNVALLVYLGHLVPWVLKVPEDFLVCQGEMGFLD